MPEWNSNNRACTTTWSTLRVLAQNSRTFRLSGNVSMTQLMFWNPTVTAEMRKAQATTIATQMDNFFTMVRGAKYERGVTKGTAVSAMTDTLTDKSKTIADLSAVCDECYQFWGETINE